MRLFYEFYPDKFNNKTNGIAHRRWLMKRESAADKPYFRGDWNRVEERTD